VSARGRSIALDAALATAVASLAFAVFARRLGTATNYDEQVYLASLDALRHGQALGSQVFASQPPGFYLLLRLLGGATGRSIDGLRAAIAAVVALGCVGAYALARQLAGRAAGVVSAVLLAVAPPYPTNAAVVAADAPSVALSLVALALTVWGFRSSRALASAAGGALAVAALSVKLLAFPALVPLAALALALAPVRRALAGWVAGAAVGAAAILLPFAGSLGTIFSQAVEFHRRARHIAGPQSFSASLDLTHFFDFHTPLAGLALAGAAGFVASWRRLPNEMLWPLWTWIPASAAFIAVQKPLLEHHSVLLAAAIAVPAGASLGAALGRLPKGAAFVGAAAVAVFLAAAVFQEHRRLAENDDPEPAEVKTAAHVVHRLTRRDDLVGTDLPIVAYLADRRVPGDLVDASVVRVLTRSLTRGRVLAIAAQPRVRAFVLGRYLRTDPEVVAGLGRLYRARRMVGGITIYSR